jgi:hypothetical protein
MTAAPDQSAPTPAPRRRPIPEIVLYFLRLGTIGFGGPVALVGQMEKELVGEKGWLTREEMRDAIAVSQSLPGPLAIQVGIFIAYLRGGFWGGWAIGVFWATDTEIDTSAMQPGAEPEDFTFGRTGQGADGKWTVVADPTAAKGRAIAQISKDRTDYRFPLAVYKPFSDKNLEISVRFKPVAGTVDEAGGVALRLLTPDDCYVARANALEDNVRFYRVVKGRREQLAGANTKVPANQWHTLALKA